MYSSEEKRNIMIKGVVDLREGSSGGGGGHPTRVSFFEPQYCSGLYFVRDVELRLGSIFGTTFSYYIWGHFMTTLKIYFKHFGKIS